MSLRRALIVLVVAGLCALVLSLVREAGGPRWRGLRDGMEFTTLRGDPYCRRGSSEIAVLRLDPGRMRLRMLHYSRDAGGLPLTIVEWQQRTGALAVFNAGQYYPDLSYMGLLVSDGVLVSRRLHPGFRAALVAGPEDGRTAARVLDLDRDSLDPAAPGWREVAQSFMLFDRSGRPRIRKTDLVANRTVVAQDGKGRILVITSEGGYTLWDFARLLQKAPIGLSHAMAMDGGYEAELCVSTPSFHYASFGQWKGQGDLSDAPGARVPLPAVVAVVGR
jgi:phosphodiester glycosidase